MPNTESVAVHAEVKQAILDWLRAHEQEMFTLLEQVVNIDSGSYNKAGVDQVVQFFVNISRTLGSTQRCTPMPNTETVSLLRCPAVLGLRQRTCC